VAALPSLKSEGGGGKKKRATGRYKEGSLFGVSLPVQIGEKGGGGGKKRGRKKKGRKGEARLGS